MALSRRFRSFKRPVLAGSLTLLAGMMGCLNRPLEPNEPRITSTVVEQLPQSRINKIDLLLVIDNSASMKDKQDILVSAVPDLVRRLVNPQCVDDAGDPTAAQPALPTDPCPGKAFREFEPITDIHIGLVSSSLGARGANNCAVSASIANDDRAHLLARTESSKGSTLAEQDIPTYNNQGFLAWDPDKKLDPNGIGAIGDMNGTPGIVPTLADMVRGVGQDGCGFESQLESWYRFLVDPDPYDTITIDKDTGRSVLHGTDEELLAERKNFLRPDSLVAIVLLTDENDCSLTDTGIGYIAANGGHLPRARKECLTNPDDICCKSCGSSNQGSCPPDPMCDKPLTDEEDPTNLRCFDQKRRFGLDFLYPLERYTNALTKPQVMNRENQPVTNPLFPEPDAKSGVSTTRTPAGGLVFFAGIVGVPWQDIARKNAQGQPDLVHGLDEEKKRVVGGFKNAHELTLEDGPGGTVWDQILGNAKTHVIPSDPLMRESREPRDGVIPSTQQSLASTDATSPTANEINGHEWLTSANSAGDLQYACIFKLPMPQKDCTTEYCDCAPERKNPLCQDDAGNYTDTRYRAKAYPGVRELSLLQQVGKQGIVASVCPAQLDRPDPKEHDYGYRPATGAIIDQLKSRLTGECLHRSLTPDQAGQVECLILEARSLPEGEKCNCNAPEVTARQDVQSAHEPARKQALDNQVAKAAGWNCFCEIKQLSGDELHACQYDTSHTPTTPGGAPADGWCYIDPNSSPPAGDAALVSTCAATEQRKLRFVGAGEPLDDTTLFITCSGQ